MSNDSPWPPAKRRPWRWIALLAGVAFVVLIPVGIRIIRLAAVPDVPEPFDLQAAGHVEMDARDNAFEWYRLASTSLVPMPANLVEHYSAAAAGGWESAGPELRAWLEENRVALDQFKAGSDCPDALYHQPQDMSFDILLPVTQSLRELARLSLLEASRLESERDYQQAWVWHRAVLRASRHSGRNGAFVERLTGVALHVMAVDSITHWADRPEVDAGMLRQALAEVRDIDRLTIPLSDVLKVEYFAFRRAVADLPTVRRYCPDEPGILHTPLPYVLGEPVLSQRVGRMLWTAWLNECDLPRPQRATGTSALGLPMTPDGIDSALQKTVAAKRMVPAINAARTAHDRERARQILLEVVLALQLYRREHGEFPETLAPLAGAYLDGIPGDPFGKGEPLRYRREPRPEDGATVWSIGEDGIDQGGPVSASAPGNAATDIVLPTKRPGMRSPRP